MGDFGTQNHPSSMNDREKTRILVTAHKREKGKGDKFVLAIHIFFKRQTYFLT